MPKRPSSRYEGVGPPPAPVPTAPTSRISNLDALRGFAVLGILLMNGVSFGLPAAAYFNLSAGGSTTFVDWAIGAAGEILVDHKMMGLFSVLFGAGVALFMERATNRTRHPVWLALWRNTLLLGFGLGHLLVWEGDILVVYALCAPFVIALRNARLRTLFGVGAFAVIAPAVVAVWAQTTVPTSGVGLGDFWYVTDASVSDPVGSFLLVDFFGRAVGMMLVGVGLYRVGALSGTLPRSRYLAMVRWGFGIGLPVAAVGVAIQAFGGFSPSIALVGEIPNSLATIPVVFGYIGLITLWNLRGETRFHRRIRAVGRMALTNYLMQTVLGVVLLRIVFDGVNTSRLGVLAFVVVVWGVEIAWSGPWLDRFTFGPFEWLWRSLTYRKVQPFRRTSP